MKYKGCPIVKATADGKIIVPNECKSCGFYNNCLDDMARDMGEEMLTVAGKYIQELRDAIKEYITEERKEMEVKK